MVLVTGASGFLGLNLVHALSAQGKTVRAFYHTTVPGEAMRALPGVSWMQCDLLDFYDVEAGLEGITQVYHCAGMVSFDPADRDRLLHVNVESTGNLINAVLASGVRKMVHVSSVSALGRKGTGEKVITEEAEWEESSRNSVYGTSKFASEMEVWRGIAEGLDAVVVNPGIILGAPAPTAPAAQWKEGSAHLMEIVAGEFPYYTEGITSWVDVDDVVCLMIRLMESPVTGERFIVSAGNFPFREIFTMMAEALGKKPPHTRATPFMTGLVWRWEMLKSRLQHKKPAITRETASSAQGKSLYDNGKLLGALPGFQYTDITRTIRRMADAYLKK